MLNRLHCPLFSTKRKYERSSWVLLLVEQTDSKTAFLPLNSVYLWTSGCLSTTEAIKASICKILLSNEKKHFLQPNFTKQLSVIGN